MVMTQYWVMKFSRKVFDCFLPFAAVLPLLLPARVPSQANQSLAIPETDEGLPGAGPIRRYDWFRKLWLERRTTWAGKVAQDQKAVVFLGDSITEGWNDNFHGKFPGLKVAN